MRLADATAALFLAPLPESAPAATRTTAQPPALFPVTAFVLPSLLLTFALLVTLPSAALAGGLDAAPSTEHSPEEVVRIVVDALRENERRDGDEGIATVFRFASPGNRASTGPLERFTRMIKGGYSDMLGHVGTRFDEMSVVDDKALQAVWLTTPSGAEMGYAFQLGRQSGGEFDGMWMTEAVLPLGEGERSGTRI